MVYFFFPVLIPNGKYKGQKRIRAVRVNTPAKTSSTIPRVPLTTLVKYNTTKTTATMIRIIRSIIHTFVFIIFNFKIVCYKLAPLLKERGWG